MAGGGDGVGAAGRVLAAGRSGGVETAVGGARVRRLVMSRVSVMLVLPDATHVCVRVRWRASAYAFGCVCVCVWGGGGGGRGRDERTLVGVEVCTRVQPRSRACA